MNRYEVDEVRFSDEMYAFFVHSRLLMLHSARFDSGPALCAYQVGMQEPYCSVVSLGWVRITRRGTIFADR